MTDLEKKAGGSAGNILSLPFVRALAALLLVVILGAVFNAKGTFFGWDTHRDMLRQISVCGILACGMTMVIVTGGIDLAVGSVLALSAVIFSKLSIHMGLPAPAAILACVALGIACGALTGSLVAVFRIQAFIATLAMMVFARGLAKFSSGGEKVSQAVKSADGSFAYVDLPPVFKAIDSKLFGDNITVVTLIFAACLLLTWVILAKLRWGRYIYAIGGNEEATRLSGAPVRGAKMLAYSMCGLFSAVAGICQAAQETQGDPEAGVGYELTAIAMVVIGGTSLSGGRGSIWLTFLGAITIGYLEKILSINNVGEASRLMLTGAIIVGAVLFQKGRK